MIECRRVIAVFAGILLLTGYVAPASAADASKEEAAIRAITQAWQKGYNAGDAKAVAALYSEQAVLLPPGAPAAKGNAAILAYLTKDTADAAKAGVSLSIDPKSDVGISGDLAWESGTYSVKAKSGATVEAGKFLAVYKKSSGKWHLIRDTWNADAAPAPMAAAPAASPPPSAPAAPAKK